ncbi:MAG: hypothetical protein IH607_05560 [Firmicutes bacterium]|nr:hypothetical protein [Bacillota bacterium]
MICCVFLLSNAAFAASADTALGASIAEISVANGDSYVRYPQLDGLVDPAVQTAINDAIVTHAKITQRLITLSSLQPGGTGLQVSYTAYLQDMLFSVVISAKGMMENLRSGHSYTALAYDLQTGERLTLSAFFSDPAAAQSWMEEQLLQTLADELSNYLIYAELTPLPADQFSFDQNGVTFYYPFQQFSLLSEYSGSVQFQFGELQDFMIRDKGSVPARLGAVLPQYADTEMKAQIEAVVTRGTLPYVPVQLGDSIPELIARYRLSRTPDQFPGGRYFQFEDAAFRQVFILSDALTSGYEASAAEGILAMRMNLFGIQTGITEQSRWRDILGEPSNTVPFDSYLAADYGVAVGTADYYSIGGRQLVLYADANGLLYAVQLKK